MSPFNFIKSLNQQQLLEFRDGIAADIIKRKQKRRDFTGLQRYLGIANLEIIIRGRIEGLLNSTGNYEFDWQKRRDFQ